MLEKICEKNFDEIFAIMKASFPRDEMRKEEEQRALFGESEYAVFAVRENGAAIGFIAVWDFPEMLYIEHFAVNPALRGGGLGTKMLGELISACKKPICLEAEPPESDMAKRRIGFYERNGFFLNDYPYIQPPLSAGQSSVPLRIMTYGKNIPRDEYEKIKHLLYTKVYKYTPV